jgi:5'-AMP-activated protein kinase regulatory beta subunit
LFRPRSNNDDDDEKSKRKIDQGNNEYTKSLHLPENKYENKFIVDGQWKHDPNSKVTPDKLGGFNNVVLVTRDATQTSKGMFEIAKEKPEDSESSISNVESTEEGVNSKIFW